MLCKTDWSLHKIFQSCYVESSKLLQRFDKLLVQVIICISRVFTSMFCPQTSQTELKFDQDSKACWSVCSCCLTKMNLHFLNLGLNPGIFRSVFSLIFWILSFIRLVVRSKILKYRGWTFWWKNISVMLSDECCWDKLSRFARIIP